MKSSDNPGTELALVWGAEAIAKELNLHNTRRAFRLLENGELPAKKIGGRWVTSRHALRKYFADLTSGEVA